MQVPDGAKLEELKAALQAKDAEEQQVRRRQRHEPLVASEGVRAPGSLIHPWKPLRAVLRLRKPKTRI